MNRKKILNHSEGYRLIYKPNHPNCDSWGYVYEHRFIIEKHLGRYLTGIEIVHHINSKKDDNRLKNLMLMASQKEHIIYHLRKRCGWKKIKGKWFKTCSGCKRFLEVNSDNFYFGKTGKVKVSFHHCKECSYSEKVKWRKRRKEQGFKVT